MISGEKNLEGPTNPTHKMPFLDRCQQTGSALALNLVVGRWAGKIQKINDTIHRRVRAPVQKREASALFFLDLFGHFFLVFKWWNLNIWIIWTCQELEKFNRWWIVDSVGFSCWLSGWFVDCQVIKGAGAVPTHQGVWTSDMQRSPRRCHVRQQFSMNCCGLDVFFCLCDLCVLSWLNITE